MIWLGLIFSVFTVLVPMGTLTVGRSVATYRITGEERDRALRGALLLLVASFGWSIAGFAVWVGWLWPRGLLLNLQVPGIGIQFFPLFFGWAPASLFLLLSWPQTGGRGDSLPPWVRWMDLLWMG